MLGVREGRGQKGGRRQEAGGRSQKAEDRGQEAEGENQSSVLSPQVQFKIQNSKLKILLHPTPPSF
ncbi:hypothetical protein K9N68_14080 [Kovacikia minuta CCNUW1]|uniref:hypothetical protein n=1 Tax=Kovacikia minuta TaxID=2931930 RepID=UPI001CCE71C7|nr:hypothetical protein [Kovacikia minuta]UBF28863.1 hypothetical protein K9N68_14080 [Kovacikia minuta CCNUW1]